MLVVALFSRYRNIFIAHQIIDLVLSFRICRPMTDEKISRLRVPNRRSITTPKLLNVNKKRKQKNSEETFSTGQLFDQLKNICVTFSY